MAEAVIQRQREYEVMVSCLLHDIGKLLYRAGVGEGKHAERGYRYIQEKYSLGEGVAQGVRYHHAAELKNSRPGKDSPAYVVYAADNISAGADRRSDEENGRFDRGIALESIFSYVNGRRSKLCYRADWVGDALQYPTGTCSNTEEDYRRVLREWDEGMKGIPHDPEYANSLIDLVCRCMAYVPSSTYTGERCDISLYHHQKTTAAIGSCIERYLAGKGISDYEETLFRREEEFKNEKVFVLYSLDMSGIQKFIYTISSSGALKGLRSRSFYLSLFMEHTADTILEACGLYRVNLIYCGGGRAHLLLPNDGACVAAADRVVEQANAFLRKSFDTSLYLASGSVCASANDLTSNGGSDDTFSELFHATSVIMSRKKLQRYTPAQLRELNEREEKDPVRECRVCGKTSSLIIKDNDTVYCETCDRLMKFSNQLAAGKEILCVTEKESESALPLFGGRWVAALTPDEARKAMVENVRSYGINRTYSGLAHCCRLSVGNYAAHDRYGQKTFEELADASKGVRRLAVLRADVDNLGALFASGFRDDSDKDNPWKYMTLSRYTALSGALTDFFQCEINRIVSGGEKAGNAKDISIGGRNVSIVYAGGDDVFVAGAWNEVLDAGIALYNAFKAYTGGAVTMSAGWAMFHAKEPVVVMANESAKLEDAAKTIADKQKNAIALFGSVAPGRNETGFTFHWDALMNDILGSKCAGLAEVLAGGSDNGTSFLYQLLEILRQIKNDDIYIARLAYTLARHAPENRQLRPAYDSFCRNVYKWAMDSEENRALQAAMILYAYENRKENSDDV